VSLTDEAIERIKTMILNCELAPGSRRPPEEALAGQFGLSRSTLHGAVRALTARRILVVRQGSGTYVSGLDPHRLQTLSFAADVSQGPYRAATAPGSPDAGPAAIGAAAAVLGARDLRALRKILDRGRAAATVEEFVLHDTAFHLRIVEAVDNPVLSMLRQVLSRRTQRIRIPRGSQVERPLDSAHLDHEEILHALQARDAVLAASAAAVHICTVERWPAESLTEAGRRPVDVGRPSTGARTRP
jgi:DNA-binding FadR family transcriptional regulator